MSDLNTSTLSRADRTVRERSTWRWRATLHDEDGNAIARGSLQSVRLSITDARTGHKIVDNESILNTGRATIGETNGLIVLTLTSADNAMVDDRREEESHYVTVDFSWNSGAGRHWHCIELYVQNHPGII
jgi:hypothetical protein